MIIYDFIEQRFDELTYFERMEMVDTLLDRNVQKFGQEDNDVDSTCLALWNEEIR
jgi:hypothetical protein